MFQKIVIGVDENDGSYDAIELARRLAAPEARFSFVNVYPPDRHPANVLDPSLYAAERHQTGYAVTPYRATASDPTDEVRRHEESHRLIERIARESHLDASMWAIGASNPGKAIERVAEQVGSDLIVLGSRHGDTGDRVDLNDRTRAVLDSAPCAIAIAPAGYGTQPRTLRAIGVGYDAGADSKHAVEFARAMAWRLNAKLAAIEVVGSAEFATAERFNFRDIDLEDPLLSTVRPEICAMHDVHGLVSVGSTEVKLGDFSATVDLLVLGTRGHGALCRLIHASTASQMAHRSRCPLLLITRSTRATALAPADVFMNASGVGSPA